MGLLDNFANWVVGLFNTRGDYFDKIVGARWRTPEVTYRITGGDSDMPFVDMKRTVERGLHIWDGVLKGALSIRPAHDDEKAEIDILFVKPTELDSGESGHTNIITEADGKTMKYAKMQVARTLDPVHMQRCATHEMGHALGIKGHSPFRGDMMFDEFPTFYNLTARDKNTMKKIYGLK